MHHRSVFLGALLAVIHSSASHGDGLRVVVCGREVDAASSGAVSGGQLIAPLKPCLTAFGATMTLAADEKTLDVQLADGRTATLKVGAQSLVVAGAPRPWRAGAPRVGGAEQRIGAPIRVVDGACVGPIADVLAALGADILWDNAKKTLYASAKVTGVEVVGDESGVAVRITTSAPVAFSPPRRLPDPPRVYTDVRGASGPATGDFRVVGVAGVRQVRWARNAVDPPTVRVVLDLDRPVDVTWEVGQERMSARLAIGAPTPGAAAIAREMPKVLAVETFAYQGGAADVVALLSDPVPQPCQYDVLRGPLRIVLDFPGAVAGAADIVFPGDGRLIHAVRLVSDPQDGHARLVLDMDHLMAFRVQDADNPPRVAVRFQPARLSDRLIVLDPGHGGKDPGALGRWSQEKDLNLDIAARLCQLLTAQGSCALMTRTTDCYFPLYDRPLLANSVGADLFVSVHHNASPRRNSGRGTETYYYEPQDKCLATMIHERLLAGLRLKDNGVRRRSLAVLRESQMPGVLCEIGYINNDAEEELLRDVGFRQRAAEAIFDGLRGYVEGPLAWPQGIAPAGRG